EITGSVINIGASNAQLLIIGNKKELLETKELTGLNFNAAVKEVINWLKTKQIVHPLIAIGFRLVMGGPYRYKPEIITEEVIKDLNQFAYLAPNHLPDELNAIKSFKEAFPDVQQIACYDTAFHRAMPFYSKYYPLPLIYRNQGLLRYGFHGLSYESIMKQLSIRNLNSIDKKIIIAHLGNG